MDRWLVRASCNVRWKTELSPCKSVNSENNVKIKTIIYWQAKISHARIGGAVLMGADIPGAEPMRSTYLTLRLDSADKAERIYSLLSRDGHIFTKLEESNFASRFAMFRDKFGTSWMLLHER